MQLVTDSIPRVFGIAGDQVQVVTPVHRGPAGTQALNAALKARLNPGSGAVRGFDVGDRVVATANHLDAEPTATPTARSARASRPADNTVRVAFAGGPVEITGKALSDLLHGWAITVHRAQGSEWEAVVGGAAAGGRRHAVAAVDLHRPDQCKEAPVGNPRRRADVGQGGAIGRGGAPQDKTGVAAGDSRRSFAGDFRGNPGG